MNYSFSPLFSAKESSARRHFCPGSLAWAPRSCAMLACLASAVGTLPGSWGALGLCSPGERKGSWPLRGKSSLCTAGVLSPGRRGAVQPAPPGLVISVHFSAERAELSLRAGLGFPQLPAFGATGLALQPLDAGMELLPAMVWCVDTLVPLSGGWGTGGAPKRSLGQGATGKCEGRELVLCGRWGERARGRGCTLTDFKEFINF